MCGIAGYSGKSNSSWRVNLAIAKNNLLHRGPDDSGLFEDFEHKVGLAHTRLSILDPSPLGHQPMISQDGKLVLVFNGEIFNFRELRTYLECKGIIFYSQSDTEVLLSLYQIKGEAMLDDLNGIFAFPLWDQNKEALLVARDALGVKPIYFAEMENDFVFASEIKSLVGMMPSLDDKFDLDFNAIQRYLSFQWCPGNETPLKLVRKLNPGEAIWVRNGQISKNWSWYRLPVFQKQQLQISKKKIVTDMEAYLRQAVHRQMVSDVPVGAFLSGGLDSSSVVTFAREINPNIHCFTIEVDGAEQEGINDDLPYARSVAKHLGVPLEVVRIESIHMAQDLPNMVAQLDEPLADPAALNVLYISRLARQQGIKVLLSGTGGDDLFTGYRRHSALINEHLWSWLPLFARKGLTNFSEGFNQNYPLLRRIRKLFNGASLNGDERLINYFRWIDQGELNSLYTLEFKNSLNNSRAEDPFLDFLSMLPTQTNQLEKMLALEQRFFLADHNLIYTDKMSMAVGVEVRVPFLDLELVEFAAQIPSRFKYKDFETKWVLKKAMEIYLPQNVIYRKKSGFGVPLRRWMRLELRDLLSDVLGSQSLRRRGLFIPEAVQRLIQDNDQGKVDASYTLFSLMCIELWCRKFIDQGI
jgi:asparagine synthase (glutamine-hydrolysing)